MYPYAAVLAIALPTPASPSLATVTPGIGPLGAGQGRATSSASPALPLTSVAAFEYVPPPAAVPGEKSIAWNVWTCPCRARLMEGSRYVFGNTAPKMGVTPGA